MNIYASKHTKSSEVVLFLLCVFGKPSFPSPRPDLLWTAPEILRNPNNHKKGTFRGDVYSYSIIMQEVISRCAPFCMLDMPVTGEPPARAAGTTPDGRTCTPMGSLLYHMHKETTMAYNTIQYNTTLLIPLRAIVLSSLLYIQYINIQTTNTHTQLRSIY